MHQQRDERDHDHHYHAQGVDQETDLHPEVARTPAVEGKSLRFRVLRIAHRQNDAGQKRDADTRDGELRGGFRAQDAYAQSCADRTRTDRAHDDQGKNLKIHQPRTSLRSSASMVSRLRNTTTTMARPIAISASGDGQHEQRERLPREILQVVGRRDEIGVDRQQDQLQ